MRSIAWQAHVRMMAAAQPFLSGAISKTVNMPRDTTTEDIANAYLDGWKLGLKALAIYRDGSKESQPLSTSTEGDKAAAEASGRSRAANACPTRGRSITHKFNVAGHEGYITVGLFPDGRPGELFITMAKEGSTIGGLMDAFGTAVSMSLQYGVPLEVLRQQVLAHAVRAAGAHQEPRHPHRQEPRRLHLPLAGHHVPARLQGSQPGRARRRRAGVVPDAGGPMTRPRETQLTPVAKKADGPNRRPGSQVAAQSRAKADAGNRSGRRRHGHR